MNPILIIVKEASEVKRLSDLDVANIFCAQPLSVGFASFFFFFSFFRGK